MGSLSKDLGLSSTRVPVDATMFASYVLPLLVCNFVAAVLAVKHYTRTSRVAIWSVICLLALHAVVSVDMSPNKPGKDDLSTFLMSSVYFVVTRTLDWTLEKKPFVRHLRPGKSAPSTVMDALDLMTNFRVHGWNLSRGMYVPRETRPTNNRIAFTFYTSVSLVVHAFVCGVLHRAILSFPGVGSTTNAEGPTIIDQTLPFLLRYVRASIITAFSGFVAYTGMRLGYELCTIPAVLILGQDPAQWPPSFDAPWCATSLHDFWGRRWQQWRRREYLLLGGYPLAILFGRAGIVLGTFLASAVLHYAALLGLDERVSPWWMLVGFGMMGPVILAERAFYRTMGRRVGGMVGWMWTMVWLILLGGMMVEGCARAGGLGGASLIDNVLPSVRVSVERCVIDFDMWLHTI